MFRRLGGQARRSVPVREGQDEQQALLKRLSAGMLELLDGVVYGLVGIAFFMAAVMALLYSGAALMHQAFALSLPFNFDIKDFGTYLLDFVSDLLLVLIIMEVLGTVTSYLKSGERDVQPFLFIGIISATRGILSIGARLSINGDSLTPDQFRSSMIELGVDGLIIVALGFTLYLLGLPSNNPARGQGGGAAIAAQQTMPERGEVTLKKNSPADGTQANASTDPSNQADD